MNLSLLSPALAVLLFALIALPAGHGHPLKLTLLFNYDVAKRFSRDALVRGV